MASTTEQASGWLAVPGEPTYLVHCRGDGRGGAVIDAALVVMTSGRVTAAALRDVPIGRIEAAINTNPDLLAMALAGDGAGWDEDPVLRLLQAAPEIPGVGRATGGVSGTAPIADTAGMTDAVTAELTPGDTEPPLTRPDRTDPAAFYARVARRYRSLVPQTAKPAMAIAQEAGVPVATARRWINEARRRGALPAGRQGRAQ
jgi:hypothetical protein